MINEVYPREETIYGMDEDTVRKVMQGYCDNKATAILERVFNLPIEELRKIKIFSELEACVHQGITVGMEIGGRPTILKDFYEDHLGGQSESPSTYSLEEGCGVSGVLLPSGTFIKCLNAEHHLILHDEDSNCCLYFSSKLDGKEGIVTRSPFGAFCVTDEQHEAVRRLEKYMDKHQLTMLEILLQNL